MVFVIVSILHRKQPIIDDIMDSLEALKKKEDIDVLDAKAVLRGFTGTCHCHFLKPLLSKLLKPPKWFRYLDGGFNISPQRY